MSLKRACEESLGRLWRDLEKKAWTESLIEACEDSFENFLKRAREESLRIVC